jgi:hypothetical protein
MQKKIIVVLSFFLSYFACTNPFATRDTETPEIQDNLTTPSKPLAYNDVIPFLQKAISEKNTVNYMNCFIDETFPKPPFSYQYQYDKRISQESFTGWSLHDEQNYLNNIINDPDNDTPELRLDIIDESFVYTPLANSWNDSIQVMPFEYELSVSYRDSTEVYQGISSMKLIVNDNAQWAIYYWEDRQNDNSTSLSWSFLKAERRNR